MPGETRFLPLIVAPSKVGLEQIDVPRPRERPFVLEEVRLIKVVVTRGGAGAVSIFPKFWPVESNLRCHQTWRAGKSPN